MFNTEITAKLTALSTELVQLSNNDKVFRFTPALVNAISYISTQFFELTRGRDFNNYKSYSSQQVGFFSLDSNKHYQAKSTDAEILKDLLLYLARKFTEVKPDQHPPVALNNLIECTTKQLALFKASFQKDNLKTSEPITHSTFFSLFRKPKPFGEIKEEQAKQTKLAKGLTF